MKRLLPLCLILLATACDGISGPTTPIDQDFTLAPGERILVEGSSTRITFVRVEGDSRCPIDAICIQGGDALVKIDVDSTAGSRESLDLHTGSMAPVTYRGLTIALIELLPYPFSSKTTKPDEYRATLRVTR